MDHQLQRIGVALRARRIELGLSQEELSDTTGLDRKRISNIERGVPGRSSILTEVANALGMDLVALPREDPRAASARYEADNYDATRRRGRNQP